MTEADPLLFNLKTVLTRIRNACVLSNRNPGEVRLLLATKTVAAERIKMAIQSGQQLIGENKVQEIKEKYEALKDVPHEKHFIGHLQTNKIKDILKYDVSCLQSLDRLDLAEKLHQRLAAAGRTLDVFIQVNTSGEESKFGVSPEEAVALTEAVAQFPTLSVRGLMTIGLFSADKEKVRLCFKRLKEVQQKIIEASIPGVTVAELSMGMSQDLETAIEEGATIIRVGTAVFGARNYPDSYYWNEKKA